MILAAFAGSGLLSLPLASQVVVEIERSAGYAERIITRSIDRAGRG
jgi:hypothetical protein